MTPVDQTITEDSRGDCYRACIASLLSLPIAEVPNFIEAEDMHDEARRWLWTRGFDTLRCYGPDHESVRAIHFNWPGRHCIVSGISPRTKANGGEKWHAVVGHALGYGIEVVHDPHPSRAGLVARGGRWVQFVFPRPS